MEKVSICICTRNRVNDLENAIKSISHSTYTNYEIIVSDDSTNEESKTMIERNFPEVKYIIGPQKGLCFNRNNALKLIEGTRVLYIDDDVIMSENFLNIIIDKLLSFPPEERDKMIITGIERKHGYLVFPNSTSFLGHQSKPYKSNEALHSIVINSAVFPSALFKQINFDEHLVYGYDEIDISARAINIGYQIILCKEAVNNHFPSNINRDYYNPYKGASRIYVTYKRYNNLEKKIIKSYFYLFLSTIHELFYQIKKNKIRGFRFTYETLKKVDSYIRISGNRC